MFVFIKYKSTNINISIVQIEIALAEVNMKYSLKQKTIPISQLLKSEQEIKEKMLQTKFPSFLDQKFSSFSGKQSYAQSSKFSWKDMNTFIESANSTIQQINKLPLDYTNIQLVHDIDKVRNEITKNRIKKARLSINQRRLSEIYNRQQLKLDLILKQIQNLEMDGGDQSKRQGQDMRAEINVGQKQVEQHELPKIQEILQSFSPVDRQNYLQQLSPSHYRCRAIDFFNILTTETMLTDSQVSYLKKRRFEEEQKLSKLHSSEKENHSEIMKIEQNFPKERQKQQKVKNQVQKLSKQLSVIEDQNYVHQQISIRCKLQQEIYENECKNIKQTIKKVWKLVKISGNNEVVDQAKTIMKDFGLDFDDEVLQI